MSRTEVRADIDRIFANWMNSQYMKLHAGEMTAHEVRTVKAVLKVARFEVCQALLSLNDNQ